MNKKTILLGGALSLLVAHATCSDAFALRLKIKQAKDSTDRVVAANSTEADVAEGKRATIKLAENSAQLALLTDSGPQSVVLAYKKGKKILPAKKVLSNPEKYCADATIQAFTGLRGKQHSLRIESRSEGDIGYAKAKLRGKNGKKFRKGLTGLVAVDSNCLPSGNGLTLGLATSSSSQTLAATESDEALATDTDKDGLLDIFDVDTDNDAVLNNYDSNYSVPVLFPSFRVFSNLKVGLTDTVNASALNRNPTKPEVDALTEKTTLAIEVKAGTAEESELNCKGLSYCSSGGTGQTGNPATSFPAAHDSDGDGFGTITKGGTGDFQLDTNLSAFNEANAGDSYTQIVTNTTTALAKLYFATLQFVFRATPAVKSLTLDPAGTPTATEFSYPISNGEAGTPSNCIEVTPNGDGNIILEYVAWRPQRAGISALGEADFVDLGNSRITIDIPNAPSVGGSTGGGPGNCPASSYSTSDSNLSIDADGIVDSFGDHDANSANTATFRVDLTACLASAGESLDSGEQVTLDLQFRNDVGDNAAQILCVERP